MDTFRGITVQNQDGSEESSLDLNLSVLTDRDGFTVPLMDKTGIRVFDIEVEEQMEQYIQREQDKLNYYETQVFRRKKAQEKSDLDIIKEQVFAITSVSNNSPEKRDSGSHGKGSIVWLMIVSVICIYISLSYGRVKKKEREKKIADLDNCYDE